MHRLRTKLAVIGMFVPIAGGFLGVGLANYTESGSFSFYKEARSAEWVPQRQYVAAIETTDLERLSATAERSRTSESLRAYSGAD